MSWAWKEERETREYDVKGTVTISTDEYRDLISAVYELRSAGQKEHDDWYKEYQRASNLDSQVEKLENQVREFNEFLEDHSVVKEDWLRFLGKKSHEGDE